MADLGVLSTALSRCSPTPMRTATGFGSGDEIVALDRTGVVSGVVTINGVPQAGVRVLLYWRLTGLLLRATLSAADGSYSFPEMYKASEGFFVVALDYDDGTVYDSLIADRITPV